MAEPSRTVTLRYDEVAVGDGNIELGGRLPINTQIWQVPGGDARK